MTHPNTDSREQEVELSTRVWEMLQADPHQPLALLHERYFSYLKDSTANKQKELLEWVEQEVVGPDETSDNVWLPTERAATFRLIIKYRNKLKAAQREQIKNKKESL